MRRIVRLIVAFGFMVAGANHFRDPALYIGMMPSWLPEPDLLQRIAGAAEIAGGVGLLVPPLRRFAMWGLVILLVAIFPANLHVALTGRMAGLELAPWVLWARLPFQLVFIAAVLWVGRDHPAPRQP